MTGEPFDPIERAEWTRQQVCDGDRRKYYRFRPSRFYGGIATADCVGCCLKCLFCWSYDVVASPSRTGAFYGPEEVARILMDTARRKRLKQLRISGNEPTLAWEHLLKVLEIIDGRYLFILETNGILIGANRNHARDLARFRNLHVRVSLKGACVEEFSRLTGAAPDGFELQIAGLRNLTEENVRAHAACMVSFSTPDTIASLGRRLRNVNPRLEDFEVEELILYPHVVQRLKSAGCTFGAAHLPDRIPPEQI